MRRQRWFTSALGLLFISLALPSATLRADTLSAAPPDQLGNVNFPTSCTAEVQPTLEKGVALLHSFQYKESEKTFADAATREPKCAIAHWGKAMALFHQLWDFPDDKTLKEGRKDIERAQKTPRGQSAGTGLHQRRRRFLSEEIQDDAWRAYTGLLLST